MIWGSRERVGRKAKGLETRMKKNVAVESHVKGGIVPHSDRRSERKRREDYQASDAKSRPAGGRSQVICD